MAQPSSGYLTEDAYMEHRWAQDNLIRKEFEKHHNHVEARHRELREDLDNVKADVKELKDDVRQLKVDVSELKVDLQRMQSKGNNRAIPNALWPIDEIGVYQPGTGLVMPSRFPRNAKEFWELKTPRTASQSAYFQNWYFRW